jgi:hypothetical protein
VAVKRFPIEAGHILTFARALGDDNPVYRDEEAGVAAGVGGIIAPPTFVAAGAHFDPDYPLRPAAGAPWFGSGRDATGATGDPSGQTALHAEQHFEYHRTLRAGDILSASSHDGRTWQREGARGGTMTFTEYVTEYRDAHGERVVTSRTVGVRTSRPPGTA